MSSVQELWHAYGRDRRPANIGDRIGVVVLGELDDEVQDVVGSYIGMGAEPGANIAAREA
jgi:hypothetical protein